MPQVVGLDIGASAVRGAELDIGSGRPKLVAFGQVGLPPGAIVDGEVQDRSAVADAIARLWHNGQFTSKSVVVGLAGLRAITRELDLPYVPDDEVDSAVRFQSEEVIPFPPDKTILSAQVLADYSAPDGTTMRRVLVAAAHRDLVDGVVDVIERAGLQVEGIDLVSSALVRALTDPAAHTDMPEAIVSVGAGLTVVVVHQRGRPQFVRTIGTGGNAATAAIAGALDLPLADAEAVKRRLGEPIPQVQAAERAVQASIAELVGEIRNSVQYFASLPGRAPISRVLLTGGGSRLRGLAEQLQGQVRIPVQAVSPLARLDLSGLDLTPAQAAAIDPVLAAPIGLALPEPHDGVKKFNLVPPEVAERAFQHRIRRWTISAAAVFVVLLAGVSVLRFYQVHAAQSDVASLKQQVAALNGQIPTYDAVVKATREVQAAHNQVKQVSSGAIDWYAVIQQLQALAPSGLQVTNFTGTGRAASDPGAASSGSGSGSSGSGTGAQPGTLGTVGVQLTGVFPTSSPVSKVSQWIDGIPAGNPAMFGVPGINGPATNNPVGGGNVQLTFSSTVPLTTAASLAAVAGGSGGY